MGETLQARIEQTLRHVVNTRTAADVVSGEQVRDIATTTDGRVRLTLLMEASDDATLARDVRQALERLEGVRDVRVDVKDAGEQAEQIAHQMAGEMEHHVLGARRPELPALAHYRPRLLQDHRGVDLRMRSWRRQVPMQFQSESRGMPPLHVKMVL